jgi:hypothetical protein
MVIANPSRNFSKEDMGALDAFLRGGGTLLLLDSVSNGISTANQVLRPYGLSVNVVSDPDAPAAGRGRSATTERNGSWYEKRRSDRTGRDSVGWIVPRLVISGGIGLSDGQAGTAQIAFVQIGRGLLLVATDSFGYSHHVLGSLLERSSPSERERNVYSEIYSLMRNLIRRSPDAEDLKS